MITVPKEKVQDRLDSIREANSAKKTRYTYRIEDYLEVVYELVQLKGYATLVDIAECLNVRPPSVTKMMRRLDDKGLVEYVKYRGVRLTKVGVSVARQIHDRHSILSEFFKIIGVSEEVANRDAERIEHHLHSETVTRLEEFLKNRQIV